LPCAHASDASTTAPTRTTHLLRSKITRGQKWSVQGPKCVTRALAICPPHSGLPSFSLSRPQAYCKRPIVSSSGSGIGRYDPHRNSAVSYGHGIIRPGNALKPNPKAARPVQCFAYALQRSGHILTLVGMSARSVVPYRPRQSGAEHPHSNKRLSFLNIP
jgi:hypothetical protein